MHRDRGFTLLELMVVIVIAGIVLATVSINAVPDPRQQLERDARRVGQLIAIAGDEARLRAERVYWEADLRGWRFYTMNGDERRLLTDELLHERAWDRPLSHLAIYEGTTAQPAQVILGPGAPPVRLPIAREWVAPARRVELANELGRAVVDIDPAGRTRVALR